LDVAISNVNITEHNMGYAKHSEPAVKKEFDSRKRAPPRDWGVGRGFREVTRLTF
jgi:hypothetical protein